MDSMKPRHIPVALDVIPFTSVPENLTWLECSRCREALVLHQPDLFSPERMVGICRRCQQWFLIQLSPVHSGAMMVSLPDRKWLESVCQNQVGDADHQQ